MNLSRREFGQMAGSAGIAAFTLSAIELEGCNAANVWNDIKTWLPTGIASFEAIVALFPGAAALIPIAETVKAAFAVLSAAVDQYINAPPADKITWLQKVELAFTDVTQNIQAFLTAIGQTGSPAVKLALAIANIILSTIAAFIGKIGPTPAPATLRAAGQSVTVSPVYRNRKQFVTDFNAACIAEGHPELEIH